MRIEAGQHAVDRFGNEFFVVDRLDVIVLDTAEYFGESPQVFDRQGTSALLRYRGKVQADQHAQDRPENDQAYLPKFAMHLDDSSCAHALKARDLTSTLPRGLDRTAFPET